MKRSEMLSKISELLPPIINKWKTHGVVHDITHDPDKKLADKILTMIENNGMIPPFHCNSGWKWVPENEEK